MGVDTKGIIDLKEGVNSDPLHILHLIGTFLKSDPVKIKNITYDFHVFGHITCNFSYNNERRNLNIHFDCNQDYVDIISGKKVILTFGYWGSSVEIIQSILKYMNKNGYDCFMLNNDSNDDWYKIE